MSLLLSDERMVLKLRSHPIVFVGNIVIYCILLLLPLFGKIFFELADAPLVFEEPIQTLLTLLGVLYYLYLLLFILYAFFNYYLDIWIVTNKHVIDIEQKTIFSRSVAKQELCRIQDISSHVKGIVPTLLNYGDIHVQTAGETAYFIFRKISDPNRVVNIILKLVEQAIQENPKQKGPV